MSLPIVVEGFAEDVSEGELVVDVGREMIAVSAIETVAFQGKCLAVDVTVGEALTGDVEALLSETDVLLQQLKALKVVVETGNGCACLGLDAALQFLAVPDILLLASLGGTDAGTVFSEIHDWHGDGEANTIVGGAIDEVFVGIN